jgi:TolB protein
MNSLRYLLLCCLLLLTSTSFALELELTQGISAALPIAVVPFAGSGNARLLSNVIIHDLQNSGRFRTLNPAQFKQQPHTAKAIEPNYWRQLGVDDIVVGQVADKSAGKVNVQFALRQTLGLAPTLVNQRFDVSAGKLRALGHHISDIVYQQLTGIRGIFSTRIAYILVKKQGPKRQFKLIVADFDGHNPQTLLTSPKPIMSPAWSRDGKKIAYVSFENNRSQVFMVDLHSGRRRLISNYPRMNAAPAWSPDDRRLALVLSKTGSANIYIKNLRTNRLQQITFGNAINTEPTWSPNGQTLYFTSGRSGSPQVYRINLRNKQVTRITFDGPYNASPSISADGKTLIVLHRQNGRDNIGKVDLSNPRYPLFLLTDSAHNESPSLAPNGQMTLFSTTYGGQRVLAIASTDGRVKMRLPSQRGEVQEPAWSPFL